VAWTLKLLLGAAIAVAVPFVLTVNGLRAVTNERYVEAFYHHGGIPDDRYGMSEADRIRLALVGLRSIEPSSQGVDLLRQATLADGRPAFNARELRHMQDVRTLLGRAYVVQLVVVIAIAALALLLGLRRSTRTVVPVALAYGAVLTVGLAAAVAVVSLVSYDSFETWFHAPLFAGDSWRFEETDTLRRLYPDRFWLDTAIVLGAFAVVQSLIVFVVARWWARRAGERQALGLRARTQGT
jgi:integral membrane protein (TIGR01906 family)